ncbi:CRISPR-associated RAMP protein, Csm3 family [Thermovibrio ammonificans HB-1]|uniref:CRISPR system Cms endoribonuclease Csm3 n=1 Tax=Thermovibrio ammonificans (strain DSM 15698 / JCM 12110 / HB-1) TaxID=648996 RepID=E8T6Q3_THEA1|nr:type III-A CRISPR-associated RAMP protein Csm3 [Thermovibrio ammonificans]ADU96837.1 CRISPR-associated RAMP protein, Csm3 family [Thermovibrio ammonificans HB-1]
MSERVQLKKILRLKIKIKIETGLHIGAGNDEIKIGGMDNPVIKDSEGNPYIPGSSIKGRMRMLLELASGLVTDEGELEYKKLSELKNKLGLTEKEFKEGLNILKLFGSSGSDKFNQKEFGKVKITRALFKDAFLEGKDEGKEVTEEKAEVKINRITGTGENPRHTERIIRGTEFKGEILLRVFSEDDEEELKSMIRKGLELIEINGLGGSTSRGYGFVKIEGKDNWEEVFSVDNGK